MDGTRSDKIDGEGGTGDRFTLNAREYITRIEIRYDTRLAGLTFVINQREFCFETECQTLKPFQSK